MAELELEFYYQNASIADATVHIPLRHSISKQQLHLWACYLDLASVLLYLVVVFFISLYQQRVLEEVASKTVTVVDYSVQVWDLPKVNFFVMPDAGDIVVLVLCQTSIYAVAYRHLLSSLTEQSDMHVCLCQAYEKYKGCWCTTYGRSMLHARHSDLHQLSSLFRFVTCQAKGVCLVTTSR